MRCPMASDRWISLCAGVLLACGQGARADTWYRAETPHFNVYSNIDAAETRQHLEQLEAFKYLAGLLLGTGAKDTAASAKFTIYLFDNPDLLRTIRPGANRDIAGFYLRCVERSQAFVHAPQWFGAETDYGLRVLLHEYAHHLMFSRMRRFYPSWYVEGFADYLSVTRLREGGFQVGDSHDWRVPVLQGDRWLDMEILLDPKRLTEAVKKGRVDPFKFYAQSWLLAHYMLADSARTQAFNGYFDRIGRGEDGVKSFEAATGMTPAQLRTTLNSYRRKYSALLVQVPNLPDANITLTRLPREEGNYLLEAAALQTCPDEKYGRKLTEKFRALHARLPDDVRLRIERSRAELLFGDPKVARTELEALARSDASSFDVAYLLGRSYLDEARDDTEEHIVLRNKAGEQFLKAYALDKLDAANLYFLSRSLDSGGVPTKGVVNAATAAAVLAPSVSAYAINAAMINLRAGDRPTAMRVLQPFANHPHRLRFAAQVSALIDAIRANEEAVSLIKKIGNLESGSKDDEAEDGKEGEGKEGDGKEENEE
jgi:hypothetical protein